MQKAKFQIYECSHPDCRLRFPLDPRTHRGTYCPRCGAPITLAAQIFENQFYSAPRKNKPSGVSGLLDNIRSSFNVGAAFRTADGAGLKQLYLCGITPRPDENPQIAKTALGAQDTVPWGYHPNALDLVKELKKDGARLIALEYHSQAIPYHDYNLEQADQTILITGGELAGVDPGLLALCETILYIPMRGEKESLNASVAFGIAAYWLTRNF